MNDINVHRGGVVGEELVFGGNLLSNSATRRATDSVMGPNCSEDSIQWRVSKRELLIFSGTGRRRTGTGWGYCTRTSGVGEGICGQPVRKCEAKGGT